MLNFCDVLKPATFLQVAKSSSRSDRFANSWIINFELRVPDSENQNWQLEIRGDAAPIWHKECFIECKKQDKRKF